MAVNPKEDEIEMFSNIPFNNGAGVEKMAAPKSWSYYTLHPKQCWYDFANSYWKTVFLRKLFKVPIPYDKLLRCIYKAKDRLTK